MYESVTRVVTNAIRSISSADLTDVVTTETRASNVFLIQVDKRTPSLHRVMARPIHCTIN
jgi:hypothetical protein